MIIWPIPLLLYMFNILRKNILDWPYYFGIFFFSMYYKIMFKWPTKIIVTQKKVAKLLYHERTPKINLKTTFLPNCDVAYFENFPYRPVPWIL